MTTITEYKERKAAIQLALATMRHNFFAHGMTSSPLTRRQQQPGSTCEPGITKLFESA